MREAYGRTVAPEPREVGMFKILGRTAGRCVDVSFEGRLTPSDFAALRDQLSPLIGEHGKLRLLFDLRELDGFEGEGLWDESSFEPHDLVERVAWVVPPRHEARVKKVFDLGADEKKAFAPDQAEAAWQWLASEEAD